MEGKALGASPTSASMCLRCNTIMLINHGNYLHTIPLRLLSPNNPPQRNGSLLKSIRYSYNYTILPSCLNTQATAHIRMLSRISQLSRHFSGPIMATPQAIRFNKPISTSACLIIGDEVLNGKVSIRPNTPI